MLRTRLLIRVRNENLNKFQLVVAITKIDRQRRNILLQPYLKIRTQILNTFKFYRHKRLHLTQILRLLRNSPLYQSFDHTYLLRCFHQLHILLLISDCFIKLLRWIVNNFLYVNSIVLIIGRFTDGWIFDGFLMELV